jgi:two-component sensor histidine kinase
MLKRTLFLCCLCCFALYNVAQDTKGSLIASSKVEKLKSIDSLLESSLNLRMTDPASAINPSKKALNSSTLLKDTFRIITSINLLAMAYKVNHELNQALSIIFKADQYFPLYNDKTLEASSYLVKGHIYNELFSFDEALNSYNDALDKFRIMNDSSGLSFTYSGIGIIYYDKGDVENALLNYLNAEKYWPSVESLDEKADLWNNLGAAYAEIKKWKLAERYYFLALKHYESNNWMSDMSMVYYNLGELNMLSKDYSQSEIYYKKSLQIGQKSKNGTDIEWALFGLYELFKSQEKINEALSYHEKYNKVKDSLQTLKNKKKIDQLENFYLEQKKLQNSEAKNNLYQANAINAENESKLYKIGIWIIIINGTILIGIGLFLFIRMKKLNNLLQKNNHEIEEKSNLLDLTLKEKELLLKEVHHRVKNNLQIISSLLNLQKFTLEDEAAIQALEESKDRIQAISLVHQKLYQSGNYSFVNFETYLNDLVEHQQYLYQDKNKIVQTNIICPEVMIDLDTAVPLGLILSELITNCYKHAFPDTKSPRIDINLVKDIETSFDYNLEIKDNGKGLSKDFNFNTTESLGMEITKTLTEQIEGEIYFHEHNGAFFEIKFNLSNK